MVILQVVERLSDLLQSVDCIEEATLDGGGTTIKIATKNSGIVRLLICDPQADLTQLLAKVQLLTVTGGRHSKFIVPPAKEKARFTVKDEIQAIIDGISILCFIPKVFYSSAYECGKFMVTLAYPIIICNAGTGVSFILSPEPNKGERIFGTSIGGGTFMGMSRYVKGGSEDFRSIEQLVVNGDASNVDLSVGDIYGGSYEEQGLPADLTASSLGKLTGAAQKQPDILCSVLKMICVNLTQLAFLCANLHKVSTVVFTGGFVSESQTAQNIIGEAMDRLSENRIKSIFSSYGSYVGCIGALHLQE